MGDYIVKGETLGAIADAIRDRTEGKTALTTERMAHEIRKLPKLHLAFGDTPPEDTSKLWIQTEEPAETVIAAKRFHTRLPMASGGMGTAAVGKKLYLFGGAVNNSGEYLNSIDVFDTETMTLTRSETALPTAATQIGTAVVGTNIYLFGGYFGSDALDTILVFDTETETLRVSETSLPTTLYAMGAAAVGTKIYLFGGHTGRARKTEVYLFDTETELLTPLDAVLPTKTDKMGVAAVGTRIYLFGGHLGQEGTNAILVFDTETETLTALDITLPTNNCQMGTAALGTDIYLFGGRTGNIAGLYTELNSIYVFDTETETLRTSEINLPIAAYQMGTAAVGTRIYLFGGQAHLSGFVDDIHVYETDISKVRFRRITPCQSRLHYDSDSIRTAVVGSTIYLFGARINDNYSTDTIYGYDPKRDLLDLHSAVLPRNAYFPSVEAVGTKIYVFAPDNSVVKRSKEICEYDTQTRQLTTLDVVCPEGAGYMASAVVGSKVYLFGGMEVTAFLNTIKVFDSEAQTMSVLDTVLPAGVAGMAAAAIDTKIYLFGGQMASGEQADAILVFDTETETLTALDITLPTPMHFMNAVVIDRKVYLFGGHEKSYGTNLIQVFDVDTGVLSVMEEKLPVKGSIGAAAIGSKVYLFGGIDYYAVNRPRKFKSIYQFQEKQSVIRVNDYLLDTGKLWVKVSGDDHCFDADSSASVRIHLSVEQVYRGNEHGYIQETVPAYLFEDGAWMQIT